MMFFLNKGLVLEQEIVKAMQNYFNALDIDKMFPNNTVNITNEHPFAQFLTNQGEASAGLFPVIVINSESDSQAQPGGILVESQKLTLEPADVDNIIPSGYFVDEETVEKIRKEFTLRKERKDREELYGMAFIIRRSERISIQIWSENVQLKNYLYEMVRLFILGGLREAMDEFRKSNNLVIFQETITGQRSGTYSAAYGKTLAGANIVFDADYLIEQSFIDTELIELDKTVHVEVKHGTAE